MKPPFYTWFIASYLYGSGHKEMIHKTIVGSWKLELDLGVPLGAGGVLPVTLRVQKQDRLATLNQVFLQVSSVFGQQLTLDSRV